MSQIVEGRTRTFTASAAMAQHLRVVLNGSAKLALAAATDADGLGTLANAAFNADDLVAVVLRTCEGTQKMVAAGAIAANVPVYAAAGGKIAATGTILLGHSLLDAAAADGDWIEILPV